MLDLYRRKVIGVVYELARENPELILGFIAELKESREIEPDDLAHVERVAHRWVRISQDNLAPARC